MKTEQDRTITTEQLRAAARWWLARMGTEQSGNAASDHAWLANGLYEPLCAVQQLRFVDAFVATCELQKPYRAAVDYGPCEVLRAVAEAAQLDIPMWPFKHRMRFDWTAGVITAAAGYAAETQEVTP